MLNLGIETTDNTTMIGFAIVIVASLLCVCFCIYSCAHAKQVKKRKAMEREEARRAAKKAAELTRPDGGNQRP